mmetsp:Transcript_26991/g.50404  ORF Transcript_26991/g.50404 Transcript_26991/m.50404 type:complete len:81 (-) Transcript_26991:69-311(-)
MEGSASDPLDCAKCMYTMKRSYAMPKLQAHSLTCVQRASIADARIETIVAMACGAMAGAVPYLHERRGRAMHRGGTHHNS